MASSDWWVFIFNRNNDLVHVLRMYMFLYLCLTISWILESLFLCQFGKSPFSWIGNLSWLMNLTLLHCWFDWFLDVVRLFLLCFWITGNGIDKLAEIIGAIVFDPCTRIRIFQVPLILFSLHHYTPLGNCEWIFKFAELLLPGNWQVFILHIIMFLKICCWVR